MTGSGDGSFEDRLRAARTKQGLEAAPAAPDSAKADTGLYGTGMKVGVELVAALFVGLAIGWGLDRLLHTSPWLTGVFALLGGAAGIANVGRYMMAPRKPGT